MKSVTLALVLAGLWIGVAPAQSAAPSPDDLLGTVQALAGKSPDSRRSWLIGAFRRAGIEASEEPFASREARGVNLVCRFGSEGPALVLTAHLDKLRTTPGANDNASGCAVLLALAAELARTTGSKADPERQVLVVFTDAGCHRSGGARDFLQRREGEMVAGHLNLDMVGCGDGLIVGPTEGRGDNEALGFLRQAAAEVAPKTRMTVLDELGPSEHDAFGGVGVDSITLALAPCEEHPAVEAWVHRRRLPRGAAKPPKPPVLKRALSPADGPRHVDAAALELARGVARSWIEAGRASSAPGRRIHTGFARDLRALRKLLAAGDLDTLGRKDGRPAALIAALGPQGTLHAMIEALRKKGEEARPGVRRVLDAWFAGPELRPAVKEAEALVTAVALADALAVLRTRFRGRLIWDAEKALITIPGDH